jgi:dipeptidyl aminopeptidase/acylaminoacyl peptidase
MNAIFTNAGIIARMALTGLLGTGFVCVLAAADDAKVKAPQSSMETAFHDHDSQIDVIDKAADDLIWYERVGDVALIDKVAIVGPPAANVKDPAEMGANNPVAFWSYVFLPRKLDRTRKAPLIVFPHGSVHGNFTSNYTHVIREMMAQGYVVVAPDYRGSTGYGEAFYRLIDYGGREVDDVHAARDWMLETYGFLDPKRVGIVGWSHGGMIAMMNIFAHPNDYAVAFAGNPVSDLVTRMGYKPAWYQNDYSADYHIGKTVAEDVSEYRKRSPISHVSELQTPLLIQTTTNDTDVYYLEVENLINALKAAGKKFDYDVYQDAPGGHAFAQIDTKLAMEVRVKIYGFLASHLQPASPIQNVEQLKAIAYR